MAQPEQRRRQDPENRRRTEPTETENRQTATQEQLRRMAEQVERMTETLRQRMGEMQRTPAGRAELRRLMEAIRRLHEEVHRSQVPQRTPNAPQQQGPGQVQVPAPVRSQTFVYNVTVGNQQFRVALPEKLPASQSGAYARLHDLLLNNRLVEPGGQIVQAEVTRLDAGAGTFNNGAPNVRLDIFRDRFLAEAQSSTTSIQIVAVAQQPRRAGG
ncbi:MAG: hypothetical protein U0R44_05695 [Candidatus Micrarchaeia archaeon]